MPLSEIDNQLQQLSSFYLNDQVTQFVINVNVFSADGKYGTAKKTFGSSRLAYSKFSMPASLVQGDKVNVPITITNNNPSVTSFVLKIKEFRDNVSFAEEAINVNVETLEQIIYQINTLDSQFHQNVSLEVTLEMSGRVMDKSRKEAKILLNGFEESISISNVFSVSTDPSASTIIETMSLPTTMLGMPQFKAVLFSDSLDSILEALKSLIQMPYGCFEQTSSTTYPMVMALQLLQEMRPKYEMKGDSEMVAKVDEMISDITEKLENGYQRLIGFETTSKGYEWFGTAPGHEALTSYGLGQFQEMAQVVSFVDEAAITRNSEWLMSRRKQDGSGQFDLNPRALDTFGRASQDVTDSYILWVLSTLHGYGYDNLGDELRNLETIAT